MEEEWLGLGGMKHILTTVFLSGFAGFLEMPVITDVTLAAVCPGQSGSCSLAVYLTGLQQVIVGLGTMVMMPIIGNLADKYGIKTMLTLPMCLSIIPPAILGYRRDTTFFYAFYVTRILFNILCQGTVDCLAYAYVARNIHGSKRVSMFGVLAGVSSISGVCATFTARFLSVSLIFQISAISFMVGLVYMRVFFKERLHEDDDKNEYYDDRCDLRMLVEPIQEDTPTKTHVFKTKHSSLKDMVSLMKNSTILLQLLVVTFFSNFSQSGMRTAFLYFLKARLAFNKNDFAELFLLASIIGSISLLFILPVLVSAIGDRRVLSTGLLMEFFNAAVLSVSWAAWVPYAATVLVPGGMFIIPSVCGIASKQVGPDDQGKVQGCISAINSFAVVISPFIYSPLTALFLSDNAPFYFPGFSLLCIALSLMISFLVSLMIKDVPCPLINNQIDNTQNQEA